VNIIKSCRSALWITSTRSDTPLSIVSDRRGLTPSLRLFPPPDQLILGSRVQFPLLPGIRPTTTTTALSEPRLQNPASLSHAMRITDGFFSSPAVLWMISLSPSADISNRSSAASPHGARQTEPWAAMRGDASAEEQSTELCYIFNYGPCVSLVRAVLGEGGGGPSLYVIPPSVRRNGPCLPSTPGFHPT